MIWRASVFLLVACSYTYAQVEKDLGTLIDEVFQKPDASRSTPESNSHTYAQVEKDLDTLIDDLFQRADASRSTSESSATPSVPNFQPIGTGSCTCVPYYLCNSPTKHEGISDIRIQEWPCDSYIDVCCNKEDQVTEVGQPITPTPATVTPATKL